MKGIKSIICLLALSFSLMFTNIAKAETTHLKETKERRLSHFREGNQSTACTCPPHTVATQGFSPMA